MALNRRVKGASINQAATIELSKVKIYRLHWFEKSLILVVLTMEVLCYTGHVELKWEPSVVEACTESIVDLCRYCTTIYCGSA